MKNITFQVEGMTCQHCVMSVKKALESVPGVITAEVNLEEKAARVSVDEEIFDVEKARQAVASAGMYELK